MSASPTLMDEEIAVAGVPGRELSAHPGETRILEVAGLTKLYPGVVALDHVDLLMHAGSIHALVGENGAGKSTLIKMLAGAIRPDAGAIKLAGEQVTLRSPVNARQLGIAVVHQHTHLIPDLTVAENYALRQGYPRTSAGSVAWSKINQQAKSALSSLLPDLDTKRTTRGLSGVEKQMVELSFGLAANPRVLILDEPTAVLPHEETRQLFDRVQAFAADGGAVLFVSHRLNEVFQITDQVTVLRDGKLVWSKQTSETDHDDLIRAMVGRGVQFERDDTSVPATEESLQVNGLSDAAGAFKDVSLDMKRGEIYGLYGLVGAGQSELCSALFGIRHVGSGTVQAGGHNVGSLNAASRVAAGLAYVPAERLERGMFHQMTVGENMSIASLPGLTTAGWVKRGAEQVANQQYIQSLRVKTQGPDQNILQLSGGNQQKVLLGRWLQTKPDVLILEEPTQGVDVGAKVEIHRLVRELAATGVAVLLVTSELPELLALSHRIGVMREGRKVAELDGASTTEEEVLKLALPAHDSSHTESPAVVAAGSSRGLGIMRWLLAQREAGLSVFLILLVLAAAKFVPAFATARNLRDVLVDQSILLIGALGMSAVIIAGGIDISVGAIMGLTAMVAAKAGLAEYPVPVIMFLPLFVGLLLGAFNGLLTVFGRVHSIVITLGMLFILRGVMIQLMGGKWLFNLGPNVTQFGQGSFGGISYLLIAAGATAVAMFAFLGHTVWGRQLYALGGDRASAELLGVNPRRIIPIAFAINGILIGVAGLLHAGRYGQVQTSVGTGFELKVIAAAVIGGTHIMGGRGSALGVLLGALFLGLISNILVLMHVSAFWNDAVLGGMILLAVCADVWSSRDKEAHV